MGNQRDNMVVHKEQKKAVLVYVRCSHDNISKMEPDKPEKYPGTQSRTGESLE